MAAGIFAMQRIRSQCFGTRGEACPAGYFTLWLAWSVNPMLKL